MNIAHFLSIDCRDAFLLFLSDYNFLFLLVAVSSKTGSVVPSNEVGFWRFILFMQILQFFVMSAFKKHSFFVYVFEFYVLILPKTLFTLVCFWNLLVLR